MTDNEADQEPSIEEILASIRQIISDDDEEAPAEVAEEPAVEEPEPEPEPDSTAEPASEPEPEPIVEEPEEDILELTEEMQEEPAPEPEQEEPIEIDLQDIEPEPVVEETSDIDLLSDSAKHAALSSMAKLTGDMPINRRVGYDGVTIEDIVRELLHPMLKEWMDSNLPPTVERLVQNELKKLSSQIRED